MLADTALANHAPAPKAPPPPPFGLRFPRASASKTRRGLCQRTLTFRSFLRLRGTPFLLEEAEVIAEFGGSPSLNGGRSFASEP